MPFLWDNHIVTALVNTILQKRLNNAIEVTLHSYTTSREYRREYHRFLAS